jgi:hypothetical protein
MKKTPLFKPFAWQDFVTINFYKILVWLGVMTISYFSVVVINHNLDAKNECMICGDPKTLDLPFDLKPCTIKSFYIYWMGFHIPCINALIFIYLFFNEVSRGKYLKRLYYAFAFTMVFHFVYPIIIFNEKGVIFPYTLIVLMYFLMFMVAFTITKENWKDVFYINGSVVTTLFPTPLLFFLPQIIPFLRSKFGEAFPLSITIFIHLCDFIMNLGITLFRKYKHSKYTTLYLLQLLRKTFTETICFCFFLKSKLNPQFWGLIAIDSVFRFLKDIQFKQVYIDRFIEKVTKSGSIFRKIFFVGDPSKIEQENYLIPEVFIVKLIILIYYIGADSVGVQMRPENYLPDDCRLGWRYRSKIDNEELRIWAYFIFTLIIPYVLLYFYYLLTNKIRFNYMNKSNFLFLVKISFCIYAPSHIALQAGIIYL